MESTEEIIKNNIAKMIIEEQKAAAAGFTTEEQKLVEWFDNHSDNKLAKRVEENMPCPLLHDKSGNGMFSTGDFCAIKSQVGHGKTQACALVAISALGFGSDFGLKATQDDCGVWYIDTEMNGARTLKFRDRVLTMTRNSKNFHCTNLNDCSADEMELDEQKFRQTLHLVIKRLRINNPDQSMIFIIDTLTKFVEDPNDLKECKKFIQDLARWASQYRVCIVSTIHENENSAGGKMTGHLGSYVMRYAREVYRPKYDKETGVFTMSNRTGNGGTKYTDGPGVEDVSWRIQNDVFVPAEPSKKGDKQSSNNVTWKDLWRPRFEKVFGRDEVLNYTELSIRLANTKDETEKPYCRSTDSAKPQIKHATAEGILCKITYPNVKQGYKLVKDGEVG